MKLIKVSKKEKKLRLVENEQVVFEFDCYTGKSVGRKLRKNDMKTPEGEYYIIVKNPKSEFYLSLGLSYPNISDAREAFKQNIIDEEVRDKIILSQKKYLKNSKTIIPWQTKMGGEIYIHGEGKNKKEFTKGCVKLKNKDMKKLYDYVEVGTKVVIFFDLTEK